MSCAGGINDNEAERQYAVKETLSEMGYIDPNQPLGEIAHFCKEIKNPIILRAILRDLSRKGSVSVCHRNSKV